MAGIITVSPYIGISPTELITKSVIQAEREMAGEDDGAVVGLCRLLELIEAAAPFCTGPEHILYVCLSDCLCCIKIHSSSFD